MALYQLSYLGSIASAGLGVSLETQCHLSTGRAIG
jgi:hypothetical protein